MTVKVIFITTVIIFITSSHPWNKWNSVVSCRWPQIVVTTRTQPTWTEHSLNSLRHVTSTTYNAAVNLCSDFWHCGCLQWILWVLWPRVCSLKLGLVRSIVDPSVICLLLLSSFVWGVGGISLVWFGGLHRMCWVFITMIPVSANCVFLALSSIFPLCSPCDWCGLPYPNNQVVCPLYGVSSFLLLCCVFISVWGVAVLLLPVLFC